MSENKKYTEDEMILWPEDEDPEIISKCLVAARKGLSQEEVYREYSAKEFPKEDELEIAKRNFKAFELTVIKAKKQEVQVFLSQK